MALKSRYQGKDEVPSEHAGLYVERDGAWVLDVEGGPDAAAAAEVRKAEKARFDELRTNNTALLKQIEEMKKRFEGIDPDEVRKLAEQKQRLEEERQMKAGEFEKVMENRIKGLKTEWEKEVTGLKAEREALNTRLTAIQIDQGVTTAATKRGLRPTAMLDITSRARSVFKLVNGVPRAFEADGQTVRYGRDGVTPMTLEEWVDTQVAEAPHLFESNAGGGAAGTASTNTGAAAVRGLKNPFRKESWNLTEQMRLLKKDPTLAARMQAAS